MQYVVRITERALSSGTTTWHASVPEYRGLGARSRPNQIQDIADRPCKSQIAHVMAAMNAAHEKTSAMAKGKIIVLLNSRSKITNGLSQLLHLLKEHKEEPLLSVTGLKGTL